MQKKGRSRGEVASRSLWFAARTLLIIALVALLGYGVFLLGLNGSNLYIIATEGMKLRAECILQDGAKLELTEYFTEDFIDGDELLSSGTYDDYTVTDYNYKLSVEGVSLLPWGTTASFTVVERVESMQGSINSDRIPEDAAEDAEYPLPEWESGRYRMDFVKNNGRWYISGLTLLEASPSEAPLRTPDLSITPAPTESAE